MCASAWSRGLNDTRLLRQLVKGGHRVQRFAAPRQRAAAQHVRRTAAAAARAVGGRRFGGGRGGLNGRVGAAETGEQFDQRLGGLDGEVVLRLGDGQRGGRSGVREAGATLVVCLFDVGVILYKI